MAAQKKMVGCDRITPKKRTAKTAAQKTRKSIGGKKGTARALASALGAVALSGVAYTTVRKRRRKKQSTHVTDESRKVAMNYGVVQQDNLRRRAWIKLLACDTTTPIPRHLCWHTQLQHVRQDVRRAPGLAGQAAEQQKLETILNTYFASHEHAHEHALTYAQGFHSVAAVFLKVMNDETETYNMIESAMSNPGCLFLKQLLVRVDPNWHYITCLLHAFAPEVYCKLNEVSMVKTLSWLSTWLANDLGESHMPSVLRLYDAFLGAAEPLFPAYFFAAAILQDEDAILKIEARALESSMEILNGVVDKLKVLANVETNLRVGREIFTKIPPAKLAGLVVKRKAVEGGFFGGVLLLARHSPQVE